MRSIIAVSLLGLGCTSPAPDAAPQQPAAAPTKRASAPPDPARYEARLQAFEARRRALNDRFKTASTAQRKTIRAEARQAILDFIDGTIFPAWQGMPWGLGKNSTATRPFEPGKVVGCSYFVTSVLQNAGLRLSNRYRFAQAPAIHIQRSLAPRKRDLHIFYSIPAGRLAQGIGRLGAGLYLIGLNNHVGFVRVTRTGAVRFVHASYTDDQVVIDEPLIDAKAIAASRKAGYFVSSVFADDRLVDHWLTGKPVPFQRLAAR